VEVVFPLSGSPVNNMHLNETHVGMIATTLFPGGQDQERKLTMRRILELNEMPWYLVTGLWTSDEYKRFLAPRSVD
jgi:hypothetical protein